MKLICFAGGMVLATAVFVAPAGAQEKLVHQEIDRSTNALVKVFKTMSGGRIEVETPRLTLTKSIVGERVVTRITQPGDELEISMDQRNLTVGSRMGRLSTSRTDRVRGERARAIVAGSSAGRAAAELIGRMGLGAATPVQPMLITTRMFLMAAAGTSTGGQELARWARDARAVAKPAGLSLRVNVERREQKKDDSGQSRTPTECWNEYSKEAIAAFMDYEECMKSHEEWWDILGKAGCATVYDMRAIGAFSWWLKCVALS